MKTLKNNPSLWFTIAVTLMVVAMGCATSKTRQTESFLTAAGFKQMSATTAAHERQLQLLPPDRISRIKRQGQVYYVYPNRARNLLFVGRLGQYQNYQNLLADQQAVADDRMVHVWQDDAVDPVWTDRDSTPGFEGPGGFDF